MKALKIKINVIWDKDYRDGEIFAEIFYRYFCSGELSVFSDNMFSIPVRCIVMDDYSKKIRNIKDYLTVNILLADDNMRINDRERIFADYLEKKNGKNNLYIPIAMSKNGREYISEAECIAAYRGGEDNAAFSNRKIILDELKSHLEDSVKNHVIMILRRVIERIAGKYFSLIRGISEEKIGLFICHTKSTGERELKTIQQYFASNTVSDCFVDKNSIVLGDQLNEEIISNVKRRAMIVIATNDISDREWCRKEIKKAKECGMPVLVIDAYSFKDSRTYPYLGNCPVMRLNINKDSESLENDLDNIYEALINEILWTTYSVGKTVHNSKTKVLPRKVELLDIALLEGRYERIIYPEPPLGASEREVIDSLISKLNKKIVYETEISARTSKYKNLHPKIMISSSVNSDLQRVDGKSCSAGINYAVKEITRYLIYMGCTILNAGNYEDDGFNKVILNQMMTYYSVSKSNNAKCIHYVNTYREKAEEKKFNQFAGQFILDTIEFKRVTDSADSDSEALQKMRENITGDTDIQIIVGGIIKRDGTTGIDKELELCINKKKSIYLLGGFGFKARELCKKYLTEEKYQCLNNGLTLHENIQLANMYEIGDILDLIFKGWKHVKRKAAAN